MSTTDNPQANPVFSASQPPLPEANDRIELPPPPQAPAPPAASTLSPEMVQARLAGLDRGLVVLLLALAFVLAFFPIRNSDFFQQLAVGKMLTHGEYRFGDDPFLWTSEPASWANTLTGQKIVWVNHSWLFGLATYLLYLLEPGGYLLVVVKSLMLVGLAGLMLQTGRRAGQGFWVPVLCTTLALVVLSPRLLFQPFLVSYLFLGLTLWLLERPRLLREARAATGKPLPARGADERSWWLLPILFVLWVNLDGWFLLGPLCVGLYLLGEVLHYRVGPARMGADQPPPGSAVPLGLVFVVGLAACLINPYHIHAFTLPAQLGLSEAGSILKSDNQFAPAFASPLLFGGFYFSPSIGLSVAGLSYFVLLLLGFVSLFPGTPHWGRRLLFAVLAALSLWNLRAIPFFAIVAGPILAINWLDALAAGKLTLLGSKVPTAAPVRSLVVGRILSMLALVLLLVASIPGWLQARPHVQRRLGWGIETDPSMVAAARKIVGWREQKLLPPQEQTHWFNTNPDLANYFAWFCPSEKMYVDQRVILFPKTAEEYLALRRGLSQMSDDPVAEDGSSWRDIFRARGIRYLIFYEPDVLRNLPTLLGRRFASPNEWALLFMDGRTAIFGWIDPEKGNTPTLPREPDPYKDLRLNLDQEAFGPQCNPAPAERPASSPKEREWYTELWDPTPMRSLDANLAQMAYVHFLSQGPTYQNRIRLQWEVPQIGRMRGVGLQSANPLVGGPALAMQTALAGYLTWHFTPRNVYQGNPANKQPGPLQMLAYQQLENFQFNVDLGPPASLYLALRAARRSLASNPKDTQVLLRLGLIYQDLARATRERAHNQPPSLLAFIRHAQAAAALNEALKLDPDLVMAHTRLAAIYEQQGYYDLAIKHMRGELRCLRKNPGQAGDTPEQANARQEQLEQLEQRLQFGEKTLKDQEDRFEVMATNKTPLERAAMALSRTAPKYWLDPRRGQQPPERFGLAEKALQALEQSKQEDLIVKRGNTTFAAGAIAQVDLWFLMGQLDKVRHRLEPDARALLGVHLDMNYPAYDMYQVALAAASGDYEAAEKAFDDLIEATGGDRVAKDVSQRLAVDMAQILQNGVPNRLLFVGPGSLQLENEMKQMAATFLSTRAELHGLRGWISLEAGRLEQARAQFEKAENLVRGMRIRYNMRSLVQLGLKWLKENK